MKRRALTLRGRVALATVGVCALALMLFAAVAWWSIRHAHETRLDANLTAEILRALARPRQGSDWQRYFNSLSSVFPPADGSPPALRAVGYLTSMRYDSPGVSPAIAAIELAPPQMPEQPPPERRPESQSGFGPPPDAHFGPPGHPPPPPPGQEPAHRPPPPPEHGRDQGQRPPPKVQISNVVEGARTWRVAIAQSARATMLIAVDRSVVEAELRPVERAFILAIPLTLALVGWASWLVARPTLVSVRRLSGSVQKVSAEALDHRLDESLFDPELQQLVTTFNHTLDRLERSFASARRFSADVAHELKTPLAVLQGELEHALHAEPDGSPTQQRLSGLMTHVRRLDGIVRKLKLLAQADAGQLRLIREPTDIAELIAELAEDAASLSPQLDMTVQLPDQLLIPVDADLFMQAVRNLLTNAVKYNRAAGWVHVEVSVESTVLAIRVSNSRNPGQEIDSEQIFSRFWRGDSVGRIEGSGLGLALTREIARAHGGDCVVSRLESDSIEFTLTLSR